MKNLFLTLTLILSSCIISSIQAQAPTAALSVQGVIRNADGTAVSNGTYSVTFTLWPNENTENPNDAVWSETKSDVFVDGGIYSVVLGDDKPLNAPFDMPYYLGVRIGNSNELKPRSRLTYSPYALAIVGTENNFSHAGNTGIGTTTPDYMLHLKDDNGNLGIQVDNANGTSMISAEADGLNYSNGLSHVFLGSNHEAVRINTEDQVGTPTLQVKGTEANISIDGTNNASLSFTKDQNTQGVTAGFVSTSNENFLIENSMGKVGLSNGGGAIAMEDTANLFSFYPEGMDQARYSYVGHLSNSPNDFSIYNEKENGNVTIGTNSGHVNVNTLMNIGFDDYDLGNNGKFIYSAVGEDGLWVNPVANYPATQGGIKDMSINASRRIRCLGIIISSDGRIKQNKKISNALEDLNKLNQLEVTDYNHIDKMAHGNKSKKGFIAQQVEEVFPEAITKITDYIPNVYAPTTSQKSKGSQLILSLDKVHDFESGDMVKIIDLDEVINTKVLNIIDEKTFAISGEFDVHDQVFVYGKEVDDFHTVDYDRIYTLAVSAVQELSKKVATLENQNAALKDQNLQSTAENYEMRAALKSVNERLQDLENMFKSTGSK